jgi:hypothetical protein
MPRAVQEEDTAERPPGFTAVAHSIIHMRQHEARQARRTSRCSRDRFAAFGAYAACVAGEIVTAGPTGSGRGAAAVQVREHRGGGRDEDERDPHRDDFDLILRCNNSARKPVERLPFDRLDSQAGARQRPESGWRSLVAHDVSRSAKQAGVPFAKENIDVPCETCREGNEQQNAERCSAAGEDPRWSGHSHVVLVAACMCAA